MGDTSIRSRRLAGTIRRYLSMELGREIADPRLLGVSIHDVSLSADFGQAIVVVRIDYGDDGDKARKELLDLLRRLAPKLRSAIAPQLRMRRVPELVFRYDVGQDHARRIAEVLDEIREEDERRGRDGEEPTKDDDPSRSTG